MEKLFETEWVWRNLIQLKEDWLSPCVTTGRGTHLTTREHGWQIFIHNWLFLFISKHPTYPWLETAAMVSVSISGDGGGEFRPEHTRPGWGCSNTGHGCTLGPGLLLLQPTKSPYCVALRAETMGNSFHVFSALLKTDPVHWGNQRQWEKWPHKTL